MASAHRVVVIGAGVSGLACACELRQRGYKVLVLEARNRVGGRLKSSLLRLEDEDEIEVEAEETAAAVAKMKATNKKNGKFCNGKSTNSSKNTTDNGESGELEPPGVRVDMGGALIHGIEENPLAVFVRDGLGLETQKVEETLLMGDSGWPVDAREDERVRREFDDTLEEAFRRAELTFTDGGNPTDSHAPDPDASFGHVLKKVWEERSVDADVPLLSWYKSNLEVSCGVGLERLGLEWNTDEAYGYEGDHVASKYEFHSRVVPIVLPKLMVDNVESVKDSWQPLVDALAGGVDILLNSECTSIELLHPNDARRKQASTSKKVTPKTAAPAKKKSRLVARPAVSETKSIWTPPLLSGPIPLRQSRRLLGAEATPSDRPVRVTKGKMDRYVPEPTLKKSTAKPGAEAEKEEEEVSKINRKTKRPCTVHTSVQEERTGSSVVVTLKNGKVLKCDSVVCTLPLAMLQQRQVDFYPPLPPAKQDAIDSLGSGVLNKCAMSFPQVFWPNSDFLGFADKSNSYLVLNLHRITGKPCLAFMYGGSFAADIESWSDQEIVSDCLRVLSRICSIKTAPDPIDYHITRWYQEKFSGMAFSYVPPGVKGMESLRAMSEPILDFTGNKPLLQFAGEHTTPFHPSTIHGAFLSGIREAYRLDCAVDPEGVDHLVFNEDEIYEPTFTLPRAQIFTAPAPAQTPSENSPSGSEAPSRPQGTAKANNRRRHRSASGMMRLRPRSTPSSQQSPGRRKNSKQGTPEPRPGSSRYQFGRLSKGSGVGTAGTDTNKNGATSHARDLSAVEDRILLRSFESFGDDFEFIRNMALPVYGSERKRTLLQIRDRCRKLLRSSKNLTGKSKAARIRREWFSTSPVDE